MSHPRADIAYERRRMIQVRTVFEAGLALRDRGEDEVTDFFLACAAYIVFSMDRLHYQDQVIHDLLKERISVQDEEAHRRLDELNERQEKSRDLVEKFQRATEALTQTGPAGVELFQQAAVDFVGAFSSLMAPRKNPFGEYTDELFSDDDWSHIAAVTDESRNVEHDLFAAVKINAPDDIDPETISVVYH